MIGKDSFLDYINGRPGSIYNQPKQNLVAWSFIPEEADIIDRFLSGYGACFADFREREAFPNKQKSMLLYVRPIRGSQSTKKEQYRYVSYLFKRSAFKKVFKSSIKEFMENNIVEVDLNNSPELIFIGMCCLRNLGEANARIAQRFCQALDEIENETVAHLLANYDGTQPVLMLPYCHIFITLHGSVRGRSVRVPPKTLEILFRPDLFPGDSRNRLSYNFLQRFVSDNRPEIRIPEQICGNYPALETFILSEVEEINAVQKIEGDIDD